MKTIKQLYTAIFLCGVISSLVVIPVYPSPFRSHWEQWEKYVKAMEAKLGGKEANAQSSELPSSEVRSFTNEYRSKESCGGSESKPVRRSELDLDSPTDFEIRDAHSRSSFNEPGVSISDDGSLVYMVN